VKQPSRLSVDLWWVDLPSHERAFFTSAKEAWHHAGEAAYQQLAAAQVFRGTFALHRGSIEHTGDFHRDGGVVQEGQCVQARPS
jgi:hypothetical protein